MQIRSYERQHGRRQGKPFLLDSTPCDGMNADELAAYLQNLRCRWGGNATGELPDGVVATELNITDASIKSERILMQKIIAELNDDERMNFFERAAIMEYNGGLSRDEAEKRALEIVQRQRM